MFPRRQHKTEFQLSISGCWCQFNANRISNLGWGEEGSFIQYKNSRWSMIQQHSCENSQAVEQLSCDTARQWKQQVLRQPWGHVALGPGPSTPFCAILLWPALVYSSSLQETIFHVLSLPGKHTPHLPLQRKSTLSRTEGAGLYR